MVSDIVLSFGPPVAIIGTYGYSARILQMISGVSMEPETLSIDTPASSLALKSVFAEMTVMMTGISIAALISATASFEMFALTTTPCAP